MKSFRITIMPEAKGQLRNYLKYLKINLKNEQAYHSVKADYEDTINRLKTLAGSINVCEHPKLAEREIRKIFFRKHDYVLLYRIKGDTAEVVSMFHTLEDYENKIR